MATPPADGAYQGAPGAFSEAAARVLLGATARLRPCTTLPDVLAALAGDEVGAAVVPIENTLAGAVPGAADLITAHDVRVAGEHIHPIVHAVIGVPGVKLRHVKRVWSHPVALAQCARWLEQHPHIVVMPAFDTAGAVADVIRRGARDEAAIAGRDAAVVYGGRVLEDGVQDEPHNFTRFVLLKRGRFRISRSVGSRGASRVPVKVSVMCVLSNTPGALVTALRPFESRGLNLTRIESRPIPQAPFEYRFHLDVGPVTEPVLMTHALSDLRRCARSVRVLGVYPAGLIPMPVTDAR